MILEKKANGWKYTKKDRNGAAIYQRYGRIKAQCHKFEECYQQVLAAKPAGAPSDDDLIRATTAIHNGQLDLDGRSNKALYRYFGNDAASPGKPFIFLNCYLWLRKTNLWKHTLEAINANRNLIYTNDRIDASPIASTGEESDDGIRHVVETPEIRGNSEGCSSGAVHDRPEMASEIGTLPVCVDVGILGNTGAASQFLARADNRRKRSRPGADTTSPKRQNNNPPPGRLPTGATNRNAVNNGSLKTATNKRRTARTAGAKQAVENHKQLQVLERGAHGIEALVSESKKRNDLFNGLLEVQQRQSRMALLTMEGSNPSLLQRFLELEQAKILEEVEKENAIRRDSTKKGAEVTLGRSVVSNDQQTLRQPSKHDGGGATYDSDSDIGYSNIPSTPPNTQERDGEVARVMSVHELLD